MKKRAPWVETVFAEIKAVHGLNWVTLRGRDKVQIQTEMAFIV
ncbi:MAG: transposase [Syntrophomonadaceae bacterium]|nr:transposase [Syntrophomonadaceae bacterium]